MMTFDVEVLLRGTTDVVAETVTYDGPEPADWTDADVREVLLSTMRVFGRAKRDGADGDDVSLRGLSWIVTDADAGVAIAIEISEWRGRRRAVRAAGRRADPDDRAGDLAGRCRCHRTVTFTCLSGAISANSSQRRDRTRRQ